MKCINQIKKKFTRIDLIIFLIPIFIFGIYLAIFFPGILTADSYNQLNQIKTGIFYNNHPFFHTLIEMICLKIWNSPASIEIFQIFFFSSIWTLICHYNRKSNSRKNIIFQIVFTILVSINPINGIHSITLWKDVLYSYVILLLTFALQICLDKKFKLNNTNIIFLSAITMLLNNIRHNGITVLIGTFITVFICLFLFDKKSKNYLKYLFCCFLFALIFSLPSYIFNVQNDLGGNRNQLEKKLIHIDGAFLEAGKFSTDDLNTLDQYIDIENLKENYTPYFMDPIYNFIDYDAIDKNKKDLYILTFKNIFLHPKIVLRYLWDSTAVLFQFTLPSDAIGTTIETDIRATNKDPNINHINQNTYIYQFTNNLINNLDSNSFFHTILFSPAFYFYLGIIVLLFVVKLLDKKYLILLIPNAFNLLGLIITIPIQDARYVYANNLICYLFIIIFASVIVQNRHRKNIANSNRPTPPKIKNAPKILMIIPAYNESENILSTCASIDKFNKNKNNVHLDYIVINDGSTDTTGLLLDQNNINHIDLVQNLGIGGAVQTGYQYANEYDYDIAIQFDGDGQHDVNYVKKIIQPIVDGKADLVIGSRFIEDLSKFRSSKLRRIGIRIISSLMELVTGLQITDPTSGFRAANKNVIRHFSKNYPREYPEPESIVSLLRKGYVVEEKAVEMKERVGGVSSIRAWKTVYYMINVCLSVIITSFKKGSDC